MSFNNKLRTLLPKYAAVPLISVIFINFLTYIGTKLISQNFVHYNFSLSVDYAIPFVPFFIVIYIMAYVQWVVGFVLAARESREFCYSFLSGEIIAKLICMALFLIIPTTMNRADITSNDVFSKTTEFIYKVDTPDNLFPSVHCLESWFCFRCAMKMRKTGKLYMYSSLVFTLLVFASTVLVKQHVVIDIAAGIIVCEAGLYIAKKTNSASIFRRIEARLSPKNQ